MRSLLILALAGILMYGCSNSNSNQNADQSATPADQNSVVITNDMENAAAMIPSWINEVTVVKMENGPAHSGEFVSKVDDKILYTYTYRENFENISQKLPKRVVVNGWINSPAPAEGLGIVMDINENNVIQIWKSYSLANTAETPNKWYEFTAYFPIDKPIKPNFQVKIYGFSGNKTAYFDDLKITFEY
ncbi:MAG: hypothetical protein IPH45_15115 [Bacteroidales bacterium]|nr:hypothetical protein [Bacteroidales bacterium]